MENRNDNLIETLLSQHPEKFADILQHRNELSVQIIFTEINRKKNGKADFTDHYFNLDNPKYFYPASTVKLPVALLALQKLHELNIPGLDINSTMITGRDKDWQTAVNNDPSSTDGRPSIAQYVKKILLVSDNDAFNRLYEFLGQQYINEHLQQMGYPDAQIIHRLSVPMNEQQNRETNSISFFDATGKLLYQQPAAMSNYVYKTIDVKLGKGFMEGNKLISQPMDFSAKNRLSLKDLHSIVKSIMFPESVPTAQRFKVNNDDLAFVRKYMSMFPGESSSPRYDTNEFYNHYVKGIYYGHQRIPTNTNIRIFNKTGTAYGFLIDASYFADFSKNVEFIVSAVIYCNSDGILNDDHYDYDNVGSPFLGNLGKLLHDYVLSKTNGASRDLSAFHFQYSN